VDDRIAAAATLLELTGDVLLVAIAERRREGDTRLVHALFAPDGRLLAWDPLSAAGAPGEGFRAGSAPGRCRAAPRRRELLAAGALDAGPGPEPRLAGR